MLILLAMEEYENNVQLTILSKHFNSAYDTKISDINNTFISHICNKINQQMNFIFFFCFN